MQRLGQASWNDSRAPAVAALLSIRTLESRATGINVKPILAGLTEPATELRIRSNALADGAHHASKSWVVRRQAGATSMATSQSLVPFALKKLSS